MLGLLGSFEAFRVRRFQALVKNKSRTEQPNLHTI